MEPKFESHLGEARKQVGLSQEELARQANVSRQTIISIEKGITVPNVLLALHLSNLVGWSVNQLFKEIQSVDSKPE